MKVHEVIEALICFDPDMELLIEYDHPVIHNELFLVDPDSIVRLEHEDFATNEKKVIVAILTGPLKAKTAGHN